MPGLGDAPDPLLKILRPTVRAGVRILAVLMTLLILLGVVDVGWTIYDKMMAATPRFVLSMSDILGTFGAFMAVLIAIEIFVNIIMYLREDVIHVKIVMATALMAIARKVIILDLKALAPEYLLGIAAILLATSIGYWILVRSYGATPAGTKAPADREGRDDA